MFTKCNKCLPLPLFTLTKFNARLNIYFIEKKKNRKEITRLATLSQICFLEIVCTPKNFMVILKDTSILCL